LSEKICFEDDDEQEQQTAWHHDFKRAQGYSDLDIAAKRSALENVLVPDTEAEHFRRLNEAGFSSVTRWFQCFSFASYAAIR
jgi:tRNA (cmo5U34)-methyltransferase